MGAPRASTRQGYVMRYFIFLLMTLFLCAQNGFALNLGDRMDLEKILSQVMTTHSNMDNISVGNPANPGEASEIIRASIIIANWDNPWEVEKDNPKNKDGFQEYPLKIRKNLVDEAICRKFGYEASAWPLLSGKGRDDFDGVFYKLNAGDGGMYAKIIKARVMENGMLKVKGEFTFGNDDEQEFTAFFAPANCGGYEHGGLRSIIHDDFPEENQAYIKTQGIRGQQ